MEFFCLWNKYYLTVLSGMNIKSGKGTSNLCNSIYRFPFSQYRWFKFPLKRTSIKNVRLCWEGGKKSTISIIVAGWSGKFA